MTARSGLAAHLPATRQALRFAAHGLRRHEELLDIYFGLPPLPPDANDRAITQRQILGKALLQHMALLKSRLPDQPPGLDADIPEGGVLIDAMQLQAMVQEARQHATEMAPEMATEKEGSDGSNGG